MGHAFYGDLCPSETRSRGIYANAMTQLDPVIYTIPILSLCATLGYSWLAPFLAQYMHYMFHKEWIQFAAEVDPDYAPPQPKTVQLPQWRAVCFKQFPFRFLLALLGHAAVFIWTKGASSETQLGSLIAFHALLLGCFVDLEAMLIPDTLNFGAMWLPVLLALTGQRPAELETALIGIFVGYGSLWSVNFVFRLVRGMDGMGAGDFKLLAALLSITHYSLLPHIILYASLGACIYFLILRQFKKASRTDPMPFGPHLLMGWALAILLPPLV